MRYTLDSIKELGYKTALVKCDGKVIEKAVEADDVEGWVRAYETPFRAGSGELDYYMKHGRITVELRK